MLTASQDVDEAALAKVLETIANVTDKLPRGAMDRLDECGRKLADILLPELARTALRQLQPQSLTIINDLWSSRVTWELLTLDRWHAGLQGNVSRRYATNNMSVAKWLHERRQDEHLEILLVANPTEDLDGAEAEGDRLEELFGSSQSIRLTAVRRADATKSRLASELASGNYDLIHYAGHAYFDPSNRSASGIVCRR